MIPQPKRLWTISLLLVSLAAVIIIIGYAWAMKFMVVNRVVFAGSARNLSAGDKAQIQRLILNQDWIVQPKSRFVRWRITFDRRSYQTNSPLHYWLRGDVFSNQSNKQERIVAVTQEGGVWKIALEVGGQ